MQQVLDYRAGQGRAGQGRAGQGRAGHLVKVESIWINLLHVLQPSPQHALLITVPANVYYSPTDA